MPKKSNNKVYQLISTLSKAEKRHFKLFTQRKQGASDLFFLQVFDAYEQHGKIPDEQLLELIPRLKTAQLSNIRNHLYKQILTSLRLQNQKNNPDIAIRQEIDFATVLYNKGLYRQALEILNKAKKTAKSQNRNVLALDILFFEKAIESQNITKSIGDRASELAKESSQIHRNLDSILHYSNLDLQLYAYYLHHGFCKNESDQEKVHKTFHQELKALKLQDRDFYTQLYYYQCQCWFSYIQQDFDTYFSAAKSWVHLYENHPGMVSLRPAFYLKGLHNAISGAFISKNVKAYELYFSQLQEFRIKHDRELTWNEEGMYELYYNMHNIDRHFSRGDFAGYLSNTEDLEELLQSNPYHWDNHRLAIFRYKLACLTFGVGDYEASIDQFNEIKKLYKSGSRSMVLRFVKILSAFAHLQLDNVQLVSSLVNNLKKDLALTKFKYEPLERSLVKLLEKLINVPVLERDRELSIAINELKILEKDPFARIAFLHFYAREWIEALVTKKNASEILQENFRALSMK